MIPCGLVLLLTAAATAYLARDVPMRSVEGPMLLATALILGLVGYDLLQFGIRLWWGRRTH